MGPRGSPKAPGDEVTISPEEPRGYLGSRRGNRQDLLLLDSGIQPLTLSRPAKEGTLSSRGSNMKGASGKGGELNRGSGAPDPCDRFPARRPLPQTSRNAPVPGCGQRRTERTASVSPIVWTSQPRQKAPGGKGSDPQHAAVLPEGCVRGRPQKTGTGQSRASPRNLSRGANLEGARQTATCQGLAPKRSKGLSPCPTDRLLGEGPLRPRPAVASPEARVTRIKVCARSEGCEGSHSDYTSRSASPLGPGHEDTKGQNLERFNLKGCVFPYPSVQTMPSDVCI